MKSPYKYSSTPVYYFSVIGLFVATAILIINANFENNTFSIQSFFQAVLAFLFFLGMGFVTRFVTRKLLYRQVKMGTNPDLLKSNHSRLYFLNGYTRAYFIGRNDDNGKMRFKITGLEKDYLEFQLWEVRTYFSEAVEPSVETSV